MGWYVYAAGDHVRTSSMRDTISCAILGCSLESIWGSPGRNFLDAKNLPRLTINLAGPAPLQPCPPHLPLLPRYDRRRSVATNKSTMRQDSHKAATYRHS